MGLADIIIVTALAAAVVAAVAFLIVRRRKGKSCGCDCASCALRCDRYRKNSAAGTRHHREKRL